MSDGVTLIYNKVDWLWLKVDAQSVAANTGAGL